MIMADLIDRAAVARKLGMTVEKFYRRQTELMANPINPFPGPVLGAMSGARWNPTAIDRWIDAGGEHATAPPGVRCLGPITQIAAFPPDPDDDWGALLDANAKLMAARG